MRRGLSTPPAEKKDAAAAVKGTPVVGDQTSATPQAATETAQETGAQHLAAPLGARHPQLVVVAVREGKQVPDVIKKFQKMMK